MPSSVAVKIRNPSANVANKLNKLCDRLELKVLDIKAIHDEFLLIFNSINDCEKLFEVASIDILKILSSDQWCPVNWKRHCQFF